MLRAAVLALLMFQAAQTPPPAAGDAKKALDQIQGNWLIVSFNGQDVPAGNELYLVFTGEKYEQWVNGSVEERGTVKLDPSTKPMSIDLSIVEGNDAGKLQLGLIEVTGDTMNLSFAAPGVPTRPKTPDDAELYAVLKKKK
ncbi:MAG TPA: TIGR03067 domain-containing protein [Vicinamibacterales bacterium]|nr:TIGR03067 domain-containing protein [Vicinamibacterales bacterium]